MRGILKNSLACCLAAVMLSACSAAPAGNTEAPPEKKTEQTEPAGKVLDAQKPADGGTLLSQEPLRQTMIVAAQPEFHINSDMYQFKEMEKVTNVNFDIELYAPDQWGERKSLLFASNELPDVLAGGLSPTEIVTYAKAKQIQPLNALLEKNAPNYLAILAQHPDSAKLYAPDGEMYGFANTFVGGKYEPTGARCFINVKWLKDLSLEMPRTYDEFYNMLVAFRDKKPVENVVPLSGILNGAQAVDPFVAVPLGLSMNGAQKSPWQAVDGKVTHVVDMPIYEEYLRRMKKLYDEKLLDNEYFTQNEAQFHSKGAQVQIGAYSDHAHFINVGSTDPALYAQYEIAYPLTSEHQKEPVWYGDIVGGASIFLTSANKNPDITMRYLDYLYTDAGSELLMGPEKGKWDGEGGRVWNADHTKFTYEVPAGYNGIWEWLCKEISTVSFFSGNMFYSQAKAQEDVAPEDASFKEGMAERTAPVTKPGFPSLFFTPEEQEEITLILNDVTTYYNQMEAKVIMGEEPIESLTATREYLKSIGLDQLTAVHQKAYDRYMSNVK